MTLVTMMKKLLEMHSENIQDCYRSNTGRNTIEKWHFREFTDINLGMKKRVLIMFTEHRLGTFHRILLSCDKGLVVGE